MTRVLIIIMILALLVGWLVRPQDVDADPIRVETTSQTTVPPLPAVSTMRPGVTMPTTTTTVKPRPKVRLVPKARTAPTSVWDRIAACESDGRWDLNTGNGYYGGLQFDLQSWRGAGGTGYPHQNSREEQIHRAEIWRGIHPAGYGAWPHCARTVGVL